MLTNCIKNNFKFLGTLSSYSFALRTNQETIVKTFQHDKISRNLLKFRIEEQKTPEVLLYEQKEKEKQEFAQHIYQLPQNDQNEKNFIIVKVKTPESQKQIITTLQPLITHVTTRPRKILITGTKRNVSHSMKKVFPTMSLIIGKHIYEAIEIMASQHKKAAKHVLSCLQMVRHHAIQKGLDEERLYVQSAITNKQKRFRRLRYHGKGRGYYGHRDTSQIRITLEERPAKQMFQDVLKGKTPAVLAHQLRDQIIKQDANFEDIQKFQFMLTSKGRQQQKLMMKRRAQQKFKEQNNTGIQTSFEYVYNKLLENQAEELVDVYEARKLNRQESSLQARQTLFQKNEKVNQ